MAPDDMDPMAVERGEGYWCYYVNKPPEPRIGIADGDSLADIEPTYNEQLVYRPVKVGVNGDGEVYAYFYDEDMPFEEMLTTGGKRFVPTQQVYSTPLPDAEPAYKHKPESPP